MHKLLNFAATAVRGPLLLSLTALALAGCMAGKGAKDDEETNVFADFSAEEIISAGDNALASDEADRAMFLYMQALEIEQTAEIWYRIGVTKVRLDDKNFAYRAFKQAIEIDPEHAPSYEELGMLYIAMGQPEQAVVSLNKATQLDDARWRAWNALGVMSDIAKQYPRAVEFYKSALIGKPDSSMLMNNIGYSYYLAGNLQDATAWFGRAIMNQSDYEPAIKNLGLLYARQGWYDEAIKTFLKVVEKPHAYNDTGYIAMRNGDYRKASELLAEAIRMSPTYYEKAYENLALVKQQLKKERSADATDPNDFTEVIFPDGQDPEFKSVMPRALNVRAEPSADSDIVNYLKTGDDVKVIMTVPGWAFVNYRPNEQSAALTGWVNSDYLRGVTSKAPVVAAKAAVPKTAEPEPAVTQPTAIEETVVTEADLYAPKALSIDFDDAAASTTTRNPALDAPAAVSASPSAAEIAAIAKAVEAVCQPGEDSDNCMGVAAANPDK